MALEYNGGITWINYDADNIHSITFETSVRKHIQQKYNRWRKIRGVAYPLNEPNGRPGEQRSTSLRWRLSSGKALTTSISRSERVTAAAAPGSTNEKLVNPATILGTSRRKATRKKPERRLLAHNPDQSDPSHSVLPSLLSDNPRVIGQLWEHAIKRVIPHAWPPYGPCSPALKEYARWNSLRDIWLTQYDECYATAVFAALALMVSRETRSSSFHKQSFKFYGNGIALLRDRIEDDRTGKEFAIRAMLSFVTLETMSGNQSHARVHLSAIRNMVVKAGGLCCLDPWLTANILSCDVYLALSCDMMPILSQDESDDLLFGNVDEQSQASSSSTPATASSSVLEASEITWLMLQDIFTTLAHLAEAESSVLRSGAQDSRVVHGLLIRRLVCISRVAEIRCELRSSASTNTAQQIHMCLCEAVLLWTFMVFGCPEPVRLGKKLLTNLQALLWASDAENCAETDGLRGFKAWAVMVGSYHSRILPEEEGVRQWFDDQVAQAENAGNPVRCIVESGLPLPLGPLLSEIDNGRAYRRTDPRVGVYTVSGLSWRA